MVKKEAVHWDCPHLEKKTLAKCLLSPCTGLKTGLTEPCSHLQLKCSPLQWYGVDSNKSIQLQSRNFLHFQVSTVTIPVTGSQMHETLMSPVSPVFPTEATVSVGRIQSGNNHSIIFDIHVSWQSAQNFPFNSLQCKLDKNLALLPLLNYHNREQT